jgi:hypothetical protein
MEIVGRERTRVAMGWGEGEGGVRFEAVGFKEDKGGEDGGRNGKEEGKGVREAPSPFLRELPDEEGVRDVFFVSSPYFFFISLPSSAPSTFFESFYLFPCSEAELS